MARTAEPLIYRFLKYVEIGDGCWIWKGPLTDDGYGQLHEKKHKRIVLAHRLAWELFVGPIPDAMCVLHHCDNPPCCNPKDLFLGTRVGNIRDMVSKGRQPMGSRHGRHKITEVTAREILALKESELTGVQVAKMFSLTQASVYFIWNRQTWRHIQKT
jgi:hypothetical protein